MARPIRITTSGWIERVRKIHGDRYDYSLSDYLGSSKPIKIICQKHGDFMQRASKHIEGHGCKKCASEKQRKDIDLFIKESQDFHGDYYDYSETNLVNIHSPVTIICPVHGRFNQEPAKHQRGQGCKKCHGREIWNQEEFLLKAKEIHGDKYDYSESIYQKTNIPVLIKCKKCDKSFSQTPNSHIRGCGCPNCAGNIKFSDDAFKEMLLEIHNGEIYALGDYDGMDRKILVEHVCGHKWETTPSHLIRRKQGCRICSIEQKKMTQADFDRRLFERHNGQIVALEPYKQSQIPLKVQHLNCGKIWDISPRVVLRCGCHNCANRKSNEEFLRELEIVHRGEIIALEPYQTNRQKIKVQHLCGHQWSTVPSDLISKEHGCPWCASSKGNRKIATILTDNNITFVSEARFDSCKHKIKLPFDFYLTEFNTLIEFDGEQHFVSIDFWGGEQGLEERQLRDEIKNRWAFENNMKLHRIRYDEILEIRMAAIIDSLNN